MNFLKQSMDYVPGVGTAYRTVNAVAAHARGDHNEASRQWREAGMNAAGDALGLATGGAGKVAMSATRFGTKAAVKTMAKQGLKQAVRAGGRAAMKAA